MNIFKLCLATCGTFFISSTAANALTILGSFNYDPFTVQTTFPPDFGANVPAGTFNFNFNTNTNSGTVSGFSGLSSVTGSIIAGTGFSTFDNTTNLFDIYVARYDINGDGSILVDFRTDFNGLTSGSPTIPFTIITVNPDGTPNSTQFIRTPVGQDGNINSFVQAIEVPFEFSPALGLLMVGGLVAAKKLVKVKTK